MPKPISRQSFTAVLRPESLQKVYTETYTETKHTAYVVPPGTTIEDAARRIKRWKPNAYSMQAVIKYKHGGFPKAGDIPTSGFDPDSPSALVDGIPGVDGLLSKLQKYRKKRCEDNPDAEGCDEQEEEEELQPNEPWNPMPGEGLYIIMIESR